MRYPSVIVLLIIAGITLYPLVVCAELQPTPVAPSLVRTTDVPAFDDDSFRQDAARAIYNMTSPLPAGSTLLELRALYYGMVRKNISPGYYQEANDTSRYLFYVMKAAEGIQDYNEHSGKNQDFYRSAYEQATTDLSAAEQIWSNISASYPGAVMVSDQ